MISAQLVRRLAVFLLIFITAPLSAQTYAEPRSPMQSVYDMLLEFQLHPHYWALQSAYDSEEDPDRRRTLAVNIERWRRLPNNLGTRYLMVNIPAFEVTYWEDGNIIDRRPVIVGTTRTPTPEFTTAVTGVVLNPWWEIPASIVAESVGALVRNRPSVARARGYVIENGRYRQRPGAGNALGRMKLVMPNPDSIGLHDTPSQDLFSSDVRAFSHGCIRVSDALNFATLLLRQDAGWSRADVDAVIATGRTRTVELVQPMPVYIVYFTAVPDETGRIVFHPDIYGRDPSVVVALVSEHDTECALG
jgi:murein L,D-transpeptidase YcbB/YkuD